MKVDKKAGLGIEAAARQARYQALLESEADFIVLAHHQDDQAETFLLQLLRGAGVKGLSAMAALDAKRRLLRPLLDVARAEIEAYASDAKLKWVEDESNQDLHYDSWVRVGMAIKGALAEAGWPLFEAWSASSVKNDVKTTAKSVFFIINPS